MSDTVLNALNRLSHLIFYSHVLKQILSLFFFTERETKSWEREEPCLPVHSREAGFEWGRASTFLSEPQRGSGLQAGCYMKATPRAVT